LASVKAALTQGQLDSLTDFVYNVGIGGFRSSTILKTLNAQQPVTEDMFTRWNKITLPDGSHKVLDGLTARRRREYQLFIS
jgi:lysozyme